jgi:hypothetical protein
MKRVLILLVLIIPALACNLGAPSPSPTPTLRPQSILNQATLGLSPIAGPPGSIVNISAAGFPAGSRVNLYISTISKPSTIPVNTLTIGNEGVLVYALQIPDRIDNVPIPNNSPLVFTLTVDTGSPGASALFLALATAGAQVSPTTDPSLTGVGGGNTGNAGNYNDLYITSPGINSVQTGLTVTITGSGSSPSNQVIVQVQDSASNTLGSATAVIQATAGYVGPWQATVSFNQPAAQQYGYIVASTPEGKQASIPIVLAGTGASQPGNQAAPLFPTLPIQATKLFN